MTSGGDRATPRPWNIEGDTVIGSDSETVFHFWSGRFDERSPANAELIVKAVNSYDLLLASHSKLLEILKTEHQPFDHDYIRDEKKCSVCRALADAALLEGGKKS